MSKMDAEKVLFAKWVILVGQHGISLLEKGRSAKFHVVAARKWGIIQSSVMIKNMVAFIPDAESFYLVLDAEMTTLSFNASGVARSGTHVIESDNTVTVQFYDILKMRECVLVSEKSDLQEMVEAFSPFFDRIGRIMLRGATQDFRYNIYIDGVTIVQKPTTWIGDIASELSSVLLNAPTAGLNAPTNAPTPAQDEKDHSAPKLEKHLAPPPIVIPVQKSVPNHSDKTFIQPPPVLPPVAIISPPQPAARKPTILAASQVIQMDRQMQTDFPKPQAHPVAQHQATTAVAVDQTATSVAKNTKLTLIFSASDAPVIAVLAAGIVWSLPKSQGQSVPASVTEIGAFRKKLSSPFRRLVGVSAHQETDRLPIPSDHLHSLIQNLATVAQQPGEHALFFGYETLSTELLIHISRFLQETRVNYQIIVCHDNTAQSEDLMGFESVFDGLSHKSWIYLENTDEDTPNLHLPSWKLCKAPSLDDAILKKAMLGEFRVFEKLPVRKTTLSILQARAFSTWLFDIGACAADS